YEPPISGLFPYTTLFRSDLLRKEWGFNGFVVTDYTSINEMIAHGVAKDELEAGALAMNAGVDMDMQGGVYAGQLKKLVEQKKVRSEEHTSELQSRENLVC